MFTSSNHARGVVALLLACALILVARPASGAGRPRGGSRPAAESGGELIVGYRSGTGAATKASIRAAADARLVEPVPGLNADVVVPRNSPAGAAEALRRDARVAYVEPNLVYEASATLPNDPRFTELWALEQASDADIDASLAWDLTTGAPDVTVAVVDSGVAFDHPDLAANAWTNSAEAGTAATDGLDNDSNGYVDDVRGWDWVSSDNEPLDLHGHGTHIAGTIGGQGDDAAGIVGVNWDVDLMPLRALNEYGVGTVADIAAAFRYAALNGARVVNASFGGLSRSTTLANAIADSPGTLFVVAAGNDASDLETSPSYPCSDPAPNVLCVAATDTADALASFSNFGQQSVDLAAPGRSILSAAPSLSHPFSEPFENDLGFRWVTGGTSVWTRGTDSMGGYLSDSPGVTYSNNTDSWVRMAEALDFRGMRSCILTWSTKADLASGDRLYLEASIDGGEWTTISRRSGSTDGRWVRIRDDLDAIEGKAGVRMGFRLTSDESTVAEGADIDDLSIKCASDAFSSSSYQYASGTSMAAPHVAGVAALVWARHTDWSVLQVKDAILGGVDPLAALQGKTVTGGRLNAAGALGISHDTGVDEPTVPAGGEPEVAEPAEEIPSDPQPSPPAEEDPPSDGTATFERSISLRLYGTLRARGRVVSPGNSACASEVAVHIKRNGNLIKRIRTAPDGTFTTRLRNRRGSYRAVAPRFQAGAGMCVRARSASRLH